MDKKVSFLEASEEGVARFPSPRSAPCPRRGLQGLEEAAARRHAGTDQGSHVSSEAVRRVLVGV